MDRPVSQAISFRRSVRRFTAKPVDPALIDEIIALGCLAPAPHHSQPWRFVNVASEDAREALADAMSDSWRGPIAAAPFTNADLLESPLQVTEPPIVLLACITPDEHALARRPPPRRRAGYVVQNLGAALRTSCWLRRSVASPAT